MAYNPERWSFIENFFFSDSSQMPILPAKLETFFFLLVRVGDN